MQPNLLPEIDESDLKAAREFLTAVREDERRPRPSLGARDKFVGSVRVHHGITRARQRSKDSSNA